VYRSQEGLSGTLVTPAQEVALRASVLAQLPAATLAPLLATAQPRAYATGVVGYQAGNPVTAGVLVSGLLRLYLESPDGRQVTVRYARAGSLLGVVAINAPETPLSAQAITRCVTLAFDPEVLRRLAETDLAVSAALLKQAVAYHNEMLRLFARTSFGSIRQQAAAHLLDLVSTGSPSAPLLAAVPQQALADAVGSTREVIARALRGLREDGLIETGRAGITVLDAEGLAEEAGG
jgi:CRP/FNR family transcriptional regulator